MKENIFLLAFTFLTQIITAQNNPYDVSPVNAKPIDTIAQSDFTLQFPKLKMLDWKPGMKFMTEPLKIKALGSSSRIELAPYNSLNFINDQVRQGDFEWKTFTYLNKEQRNFKLPTGNVIYTYLIFECEGKKYEYEYTGDSNLLRKSPATYIKKIVYLDEVDKVKEQLNGKTLFILTSQWMKEDEKGKMVSSDGNKKYVEVTITAVGVGTQDGPSKVVFRQNGSTKEGFLNIRLSGINQSSGLFGIDFDRAFSFEDPRKKYPKIKPEIWTVIQNESIRIGMTKEEVELSWGKPKELHVNGTNEEWVYDASGTLHFKNGVVSKIEE